MNRPLAFFSLLVVSLLMLACGSGGGGSGRQLQSISISQSLSGGQIEFVATGTFSAVPTTVSPLPVMWTNGLYAPPPSGNLDYTLTAQPYAQGCTGTGPAVLQVSAIAPSDPNAPMSGAWPFSKMTLAYATANC